MAWHKWQLALDTRPSLTTSRSGALSRRRVRRISRPHPEIPIRRWYEPVPHSPDRQQRSRIHRARAAPRRCRMASPVAPPAGRGRGMLIERIERTSMLAPYRVHAQRQMGCAIRPPPMAQPRGADSHKRQRTRRCGMGRGPAAPECGKHDGHGGAIADSVRPGDSRTSRALRRSRLSRWSIWRSNITGRSNYRGR